MKKRRKKHPRSWKPDLSICALECVDMKNGVLLYICRSPQWQMPLGFVWAEAQGMKVLEILDCYVPWNMREGGVMTWMLDKLRKEFPLLRTLHGSDTGGLEFLKAYGFKWNCTSACWSIGVPVSTNNG